jgi:hypothetical protein
MTRRHLFALVSLWVVIAIAALPAALFMASDAVLSRTIAGLSFLALLALVCERAINLRRVMHSE